MKKILIGVVIGCIFAVSVHGEKMPCLSHSEFALKFPEYDKEREYRAEAIREHRDIIEAGWSQNCLGGVHNEMEVPVGVATTSYQYGCRMVDGKATKYRFKVIVKQTNPCYVVSKRSIGATTKKLNSNTVEIIATEDSWCELHLLGRRGQDFKYKPLDKKRVKQVLGNSLSCLNEENEETWEIFTKEGNNWKPFDTLHFTYTKNHRILKRLNKNYVSKKHMQAKPLNKKNKNKKKQETRIRIYKYGAPDGFGRTFNSPSDCEAERAKLTESHKGLDYEYKCEKM